MSIMKFDNEPRMCSNPVVIDRCLGKSRIGANSKYDVGARNNLLLTIPSNIELPQPMLGDPATRTYLAPRPNILRDVS